MGTKKQREATAPAMYANYRNQCAADCGTWVQVNDQIMFQLGGVVHSHCHDPLLDLPDPYEQDAPDTYPLGLRKGEQVCTSCNLVHRGECF